MFGTHDLWLFIASGLLLNVTPGPDTLYIVGRATGQGRRAGVIAALGIGAGTLVHVTAASAGLSAILATSAAAFMVIKWVGAAYLIYMGVGMLRSTRAPAAVGAQEPPPALAPRQVFLQGFLTNVLNPKVALFFLAFLPQFVAVDAPSKPVALLFLGVLFDLNGTAWNLLVGWTAARFSRRLARSGQLKQWLDRSLGALFVGLGIKLAVASRR